MEKIKYTLWFNKFDLTIRNDKIMNDIYFVEDYEIEDNMEMIAVRFKASFADRNIIMEKAFNVGATLVSVGTYK